MVMPALAGRALVASLTNRQGADVPARRLAVLSTANDSAFLLTTTLGDRRAIGVTNQAIVSLVAGRVQLQGVCRCLITGTVTRGRFLQASTVSGALIDTGTLAASATEIPAGACAVALEGGTTGQEITILFFGIGGGATGGGGGTYVYNTGDPDKPPASPNAMDDEFDDTTGMSGSVNGLNGRWSWLNQGSATISFTTVPGSADLNIGAAQAADSFRMLVQTAPVTQNWEFTAKFCIQCAANGRARAGFIMAASGATPGLFDWTVGVDATNTQTQCLQWTWPGTFSAGVSGNGGITPNAVYLKIIHTQSSGAITLWWSSSGKANTWVRGGSFTRPFVIDRIGFFVNEHDSFGATHCVCDWFRRTA
jgi:hypothetical protein